MRERCETIRILEDFIQEPMYSPDFRAVSDTRAAETTLNFTRCDKERKFYSTSSV